MGDPQNTLFILSGVNAVLLSVVSFFLRSLHFRFSQLEMEVKGAIISAAVEQQRIVQMEKDLAELKQIVMSTLFRNHARKV